MRKGFLVVIALLVCAQNALARPTHVVCVEAVWCNIATQLGGDAIVSSDLLRGQGKDPHFQQLSPTAMRQLSETDLVVRNGGDYDHWVDAALSASRVTPQQTINVAHLVPELAPLNPHLFYNLTAVRKFAYAFSDALIRLQPAMQAQLVRRRDDFLSTLARLEVKVAVIRAKHAGAYVAESEPVASFLLRDMGLKSFDPKFAQAVMHHSEPSPRQIAEVEMAFKTHRVRAFIVNPTVVAPSVDVLKDRARVAGIPLIFSPEYPAPGLLWQDWIDGQIDALESVLR